MNRQEIKAAAQKKLATLLEKHGVFDLEDEILSLFGETGEECIACDGEGEIDLRDSSPRTTDYKTCEVCKGTGYKLWKIKLVVDGVVIE